MESFQRPVESDTEAFTLEGEAPKWTEMKSLNCAQRTLYTWSAMKDVNPLPVERAEGIYIYETGGKRHYDFNSQLMSVNIGHGHPKVIAAMKEQLDTLIYAFPGSATEPRARLSQKLAALLPEI